jgi:hypothetical protein
MIQPTDIVLTSYVSGALQLVCLSCEIHIPSESFHSCIYYVKFIKILVESIYIVSNCVV